MWCFSIPLALRDIRCRNDGRYQGDGDLNAKCCREGFLPDKVVQLVSVLCGFMSIFSPLVPLLETAL